MTFLVKERLSVNGRESIHTQTADLNGVTTVEVARALLELANAMASAAFGGVVKSEVLSVEIVNAESSEHNSEDDDVLNATEVM